MNLFYGLVDAMDHMLGDRRPYLPSQTMWVRAMSNDPVAFSKQIIRNNKFQINITHTYISCRSLNITTNNIGFT